MVNLPSAFVVVVGEFATLSPWRLGHVLIAIVTTIALFHRLEYGRRRRRKSLWPVAPGALPLVGHSLSLSNPEEFSRTLEDWADAIRPEHGAYEISLLGRRWVILCRTESVMAALRLRPNRVRRADVVGMVLGSLGADGIFSAEGDVWKSERRIVAPALNARSVNDYLPTIKAVAGRLVRKWHEAGEGATVTANEDLGKCSLDVASLVILGTDLDSLGSERSIGAENIHTLFKCAHKRSISPVAYWKIPFVGQQLDGGGAASKNLFRWIHMLIQDYRMNGSKKKTIMSKTVDMVDQETSKLNEHRMAGNLFTLILGGSETVGMAMTSCLWELAIDQTGLQDEIFQEISCLHTTLDQLSMDDLSEGLPKLKSLYFEALRLRGPSVMLFLQPSKDVEIEGNIVSPNEIIVPLTEYITKRDVGATSSEIPFGPNGEKPEEFCARRWLVSSQREDQKDPDVKVMTPANKFGGFLSFGHGVRSCPGRIMADVEAMTFLAYILGNFEISLERHHPPRKLVDNFSRTFDGDIRLTLGTRK